MRRTKVSTLDELSFEVLVKYFNKYLTAFHFKIADFEKNMETLQILYSRRILTELEKKPKLQEFHLEFLLNRYLKHINIDTLLEKCKKKDFIVKKLISFGDSLSTITCFDEDDDRCQSYTVSVLEAVLPYAVNVLKISIPERCDDQMLRMISSSCVKLEALDIRGSSVTNKGMENFLNESRAPLKFLNVTDIELSSYVIKILLNEISTLQELKFLDLPRILYFLHNQDDVVNAKKYKLTSLDFSAYHHSQILEKLLVRCNDLCPSIKKLMVSISKVVELNACLLYSQLESFEINGDIDLDYFLFSRGNQLKNLTIRNCKLSIITLIESCPNLETMGLLNNVQFLKSNKNCKKSLENIKSLKLDMKFINDKNVINYIVLLLHSCINLMTLSLCNFVCTSGGIEYNSILRSISNNLKHLYFISSCVNENFLSDISTTFKNNNISLESITFQDCENDADEDDVNFYFRDVIKIFDGEQYYELEPELSDSDMELYDSDSSDDKFFYYLGLENRFYGSMFW